MWDKAKRSAAKPDRAGQKERKKEQKRRDKLRRKRMKLRARRYKRISDGLDLCLIGACFLAFLAAAIREMRYAGKGETGGGRQNG